ncbi:hypothetical protein B0H13DRAFT_2422179 [Mycena leptocephala]|nr:hypothetical protein B0H13DRAFT_2422179 [Mycena leptocephala]
MFQRLTSCALFSIGMALLLWIQNTYGLAGLCAVLASGATHLCPATVDVAFIIYSTERGPSFSHQILQFHQRQIQRGSVWTDANALETVHELMLLTKRTDFDGVADNSYIGRHALNTSTDWQAFTGGFIDDAGWVVLAIWTMADYKKFRGEANVDTFLVSAGQLYDKIAANWDDTCGGGVWWTTDHGYKNAITNELFLTLSARDLLENAKKVAPSSDLPYA